MSDASRFTPLYVTRMFLDMLHFHNKNIIIPEAFLECGPTYEENLRHDLMVIDVIANSGDTQRIIDFVMTNYLMLNRFDIETRYGEITFVLCFNYTPVDETFAGSKREPIDFNAFMQNWKYPNVINQDVAKDLTHFDRHTTDYRYGYQSSFDCVFRYILYAKTKHLGIYKQNLIDFNPDDSRGIAPNFLFNY